MEQRNGTSIAPAQLAMVMAASLLADAFLQPFGRRSSLLAARQGILCAAGQMAFFSLLLWMLCKNARQALTSRLFNGALCVTLVLSAALEIVQGERFYSQSMRTGLPVGIFLVLLFVAVFYGVYSGLNALTRTAAAVLVLTLVSVGLLLLSVLPQLRFVNLQPASLAVTDLGRGFASQFYLAPELVLWAILWTSCSSKKNNGHEPVVVFGWLFAAQALFCLLGEMTLGQGYQQEEQPLFTIARLGGISVFRRLDALHAFVWMLLLLVKLTLYFWAAEETLRRLFPFFRGHGAYYTAVAGVIGVFLAAWGKAEQTAYWIQQLMVLVLILWLIVRRFTAGKEQMNERN